MDLNVLLLSFEIQVAEGYRSKGVGLRMMKMLELIGLKFKMGKLMLTVFKGKNPLWRAFPLRVTRPAPTNRAFNCCSKHKGSGLLPRQDEVFD